MRPRFRAGIAGCLGVGLVALMWLEVWRWGGGLIRLPVPIGGDEGLPVPLVSWLGVAVYAVSFNRVFGGSRTARWGAVARLGLGLHALMLLARQPSYMASVPSGELAGWYLRYWQAAWAAALAGGLAGAGWFIGRWRRARGAEPWLLFSPLLGGYAVFWAASWRLAPGLVLGATLAGAGLFGAGRLRMFQEGWGRLRAALRREGIFLMLVFVAALALRLFYTARVMTNPDFLNTGSDGPTYDALAWALVQGQPPPESLPWWSTHEHFFTPGYVRFVALIYGLVGRSYAAVCAVQAVMGAAACVLMYAVAKRLFGVPVGRLAAMFGVVSFPMIFSAAALGHQAADLFWTLAVIWCLLQYLERPERRGRWLLGIGLLLGWAAMTREGNIAFWLFLLIWFLLGIRVRIGWPRAALHAAVLSLGFGLVALPFLRGTGGGIRERLDLQWFYHQYASTPINSWFNPWRDPAGAWALLREQPAAVLLRVGEAVVGNFNALFLNQGYGSFDPVFLARGSPYYFGMWWYAYCLAFAGLWLLLRRAWRAPVEHLGWWLLVGLLAARTSVHLFFQSAYRHRAPLEPYLIILAAFAMAQLLTAGRARAAVQAS